MSNLDLCKSVLIKNSIFGRSSRSEFLINPSLDTYKNMNRQRKMKRSPWMDLLWSIIFINGSRITDFGYFIMLRKLRLLAIWHTLNHTGSFFRYFYNSSIDDCSSFNYGGCDGNENNFHSLFACRAICQKPNTTEEDLIFKVS